MATISLCMIVKNEEAVLARCLDSIADLMDEIIIVDTGSTDHTKEIAAKYTSQIYDFKWTSDFSAARNFSFSKANMDYIYTADADEVLDDFNHERFLRLKNALLPEIEIVQMKYVTDAVCEIKRALNNRIPLIGFSGSPFTLACYMVEGGSSSNYRKVKEMMYRRPDLFNEILEKNTDAVIAYLNAQIESGVDAVMVFDTWGGTLSHEAYLKFSLPCLKRIVNSVKRERHGQKIPSIVFTKGCAPWVKEISEIGADAMGLDWTVSLGEVRALTQDKVALQGNLDPSVLFAGEDVVRQEARKVIEDFGHVGNGGHVFNLGHGIDKDTDPEVVAALVDEVHSYSRKFHSR